jgi:hypothetical protein
MVFTNETAIVNIGENTHEEPFKLLAFAGSVIERGNNSLAIHPIGHPTMSRDAMTEIFDVESTFKPRSKESSERSNKGCEARHKQ